MGAILVIVLLALLLVGDRLKFPIRAGGATPRVVEAKPDPESMDRYFTAAVVAGVIDKAHYQARMAALAATTGLYVDEDVPARITDPRLRTALRLARQGSGADELVRLLGITHADAVRMIIAARETR